MPDYTYEETVAIPVITLPPGYSSSDIVVAQELLKKVVDNPAAGIVLPPGFGFTLVR